MLQKKITDGVFIIFSNDRHCLTLQIKEVFTFYLCFCFAYSFVFFSISLSIHNRRMRPCVIDAAAQITKECIKKSIFKICICCSLTKHGINIITFDIKKVFFNTLVMPMAILILQQNTE